MKVIYILEGFLKYWMLVDYKKKKPAFDRAAPGRSMDSMKVSEHFELLDFPFIPTRDFFYFTKEFIAQATVG